MIGLNWSHFFLKYKYSWFGVFPGGSDNKESACNVGDPSLIPGLGRSPGKGYGIHSSTLAWRTPWTEKPGGLQSMGSQTVGHSWAINIADLQCFRGTAMWFSYAYIPILFQSLFHYRWIDHWLNLFFFYSIHFIPVCWLDINTSHNPRSWGCIINKI